MQTPLIIQAIGHAARKRRLLDPDQANRLADALTQRGLDSLERMRAWLSGANGISVTLARELLKSLARPEQAPFGPYQPFAHLANGGMGSVWLAADRAQTGLVVVKAMRKDVAGNDEFRKRFARETKIMMQIDHPGVVRCIDSGTAADEVLYMVLEFVDGGDLKDLAEGRGVPEGLALQIASHLAGALGAAEQHHLIHRDVKPANIFAYPDGRAKLADFGIARSTDNDQTALTMQGTIVGSPPNMSPEQISGEVDLDIRTDIYSLGSVLYYALAGVDCFTGRMQEILVAHKSAPVPDIRKVRPEVSALTADLISRCLQKKRDQRFANPAELSAAINAALVGIGLTPGTSQNLPVLPPRAPMPPSPQQEMTETMLIRLTAAGADVSGDSTAMLAQRTPTSFRAVGANQPPGTEAPSLIGDLGTALGGSWVTLAGAEAGRAVMLWAKPKLSLGKLREPPIDLCIRSYPLAEQREACMRVSRHHLDLQLDPTGGLPTLADVGSGNGTVVDGQPLPPNRPLALRPDQDYQVVVAGVVTLRLRALSAIGQPVRTLTGTPASRGSAPCGIDTAHQVGAILITRPSNRPELTHALVGRSIAIGGEPQGLQLSGATVPASCEISQFDGRWIWRERRGQGPWRPLTSGTSLLCGGLPLIARAGSYEDF